MLTTLYLTYGLFDVRVLYFFAASHSQLLLGHIFPETAGCADTIILLFLHLILNAKKYIKLQLSNRGNIIPTMCEQFINRIFFRDTYNKRSYMSDKTY